MTGSVASGLAGLYAYHVCAGPVTRRAPRDIGRTIDTGDNEWSSPDRRLRLAGMGRAEMASTTGRTDGDLAIALVGTILNRSDLVATLPEPDAAPDDMSDAALALRLFIREGVEALPLLDGALAIVLWDGRRDQLLLARSPSSGQGIVIDDDGWSLRFVSHPACPAVEDEAGSARASVRRGWLLPRGHRQLVGTTGPHPIGPWHKTTGCARPIGRGGPRKFSVASPKPIDMLALVTDAFGGRGGIAQYNRDLSQALAAAESVRSLTLLPRLAPDAFLDPGPRIRQAPPVRGRAAFTVAAVRELTRRPVNAVFCGHLYMAPLARAAALIKGAKLIVQAHGIEAWPRPNGLIRAAVAAADCVLCVSRHTRQALLAWSVIAPERVLVLPNTVRDVFRPGGDQDCHRRAWQLENKRVLLTVARLDPAQRHKGHDRVITILPDLVAAGHDVVYLIAGEGGDRDRLEALAHRHGVADRVRFAGRVSTQALVQAYHLADLYVMPSHGEGFGIAYLEAMACGTPALALDTGGSRDALCDGALGTLAEETDLSRAIAALLQRPKPDPDALSQAVRARFGREAFTRQVHAIVERIVGDAPARGTSGAGLPSLSTFKTAEWPCPSQRPT